MFILIKNSKPAYPNDISPDSIDFLSKIFVPDPKKRLGANGAAEVKSHRFFKGMDWDAIYNKKIKPPFMPRITKKDETRYVHQEFLEEQAVDSVGQSLNSNDDKFMSGSFDYCNSLKGKY